MVIATVKYNNRTHQTLKKKKKIIVSDKYGHLLCIKRWLEQSWDIYWCRLPGTWHRLQLSETEWSLFFLMFVVGLNQHSGV